MEGVVTEVEQQKPENVEEKTVAGKHSYPIRHNKDASIRMSLRVRRIATAGWSHVSGCDAPICLPAILGD